MTIQYVHHIGPINADSASTIRTRCLQALLGGASEIHLFLSTEGGNVTAGFALYHSLKALPVPLFTYNVGSVESIGVPIFLTGTRRIACPHSRFLVHPLHWGFGDARSADHSRLSEWQECIDFDAERYIRVFEDATCDAEEAFDVRAALRVKAVILRPQEARKAGIVHEISQPRLPLSGAGHWWTAGG